MTVRLSPPQRLAVAHDLDGFNSGVPALDDWLKQRARHNHAEGGLRCYVLCDGAKVIGYYSLAAGSILHGAAAGRTRRNMPDPVPAVLLGRLAIDLAWQGRGLGADLLRDAVLRATIAGETIGVRAIFVHAISDSAARFYEKHGFKPSPIDSLMLMITLADTKAMLAPPP